MSKLRYEVTEARPILGQMRGVGDVLQMTSRAAKYYTQPHGSGLVLAGGADVVAPAPVVDAEDEKPARKASRSVK